ncbi:MAG: restriction endonuclease [Flavobacteriales bacterium]|nr:restriction endonuclease [Flavobacteriales bacterium]
MKRPNKIAVFEHQRLKVDGRVFTDTHLKALMRLNEYHGFYYFDFIPNGVQFKQYVGVIQVDGLTIEILPKADKDYVKSGDEEQETKWRGVLLQMLKKCGRLKADTAGAAHVRRQHLNLLEVYFELYLAELDGLIRRGLVKQYRRETKNVNALKGKLEFAGHIQKNLIHKERFYTTHQVYDTNHQLHQVLYAALEVVDQFTKGGRLADYCKRVELGFPKVERVKVTEALLNGVKLNRKTEPYAYAFELARLILLNYSPDISAGKERMLALLFDMNELWEEYVLVMLRKHVAEHNKAVDEGKSKGLKYSVKGQDKKQFWQDSETQYWRHVKPDIVLKEDKENGISYIIDTKWKRPTDQKASIEDIRQMYAYNRLYKATKSLLLYPGDKALKSGVFKDDINGLQHHCMLGFVSVLDGDKLSDKIGEEVLEMVVPKVSDN